MEPVTVADLSAVIAEMQAQQGRVARFVEGLGGVDWLRRPGDVVVVALRGHGHFGDYRSEATWSAGQIVGHLTDSAQVFRRRILSVLEDDDPWLPDFVPEEASLVASYAARDEGLARAALSEAQQSLFQTMGEVRPGDLGRPATHAVDGRITLGDIVLFLPRHQRDHADQLERLVALTVPRGRAEALVGGAAAGGAAAG